MLSLDHARPIYAHESHTGPPPKRRRLADPGVSDCQIIPISQDRSDWRLQKVLGLPSLVSNEPLPVAVSRSPPFPAHSAPWDASSAFQNTRTHVSSPHAPNHLDSDEELVDDHVHSVAPEPFPPGSLEPPASEPAEPLKTDMTAVLASFLERDQSPFSSQQSIVVPSEPIAPFEFESPFYRPPSLPPSQSSNGRRSSENRQLELGPAADQANPSGWVFDGVVEEAPDSSNSAAAKPLGLLISEEPKLNDAFDSADRSDYWQVCARQLGFPSPTFLLEPVRLPYRVPGDQPFFTSDHSDDRPFDYENTGVEARTGFDWAKGEASLLLLEQAGASFETEDESTTSSPIHYDESLFEDRPEPPRAKTPVLSQPSGIKVLIPAKHDRFRSRSGTPAGTPAVCLPPTPVPGTPIASSSTYDIHPHPALRP